MKIKTNIRAGSGGTSSSTDTSTSTNSGGVNSGGVNSGGGKTAPAPVYYSRCVGI